MVAVVAPRVRKTARAGRARGWPDRARAPAWTVTVLNVSIPQWPTGEIVKTVPAASHDRSTACAGSILSAASTDAASIGAVNGIVTGSLSPRSAENFVEKAAAARGTIGVIRVATVGAG